MSSVTTLTPPADTPIATDDSNASTPAPLPWPQASPQARQRHRVVIVGAGFAGVEVARNLTGSKAAARLDVVLVDRRNFSLFQPLLYQVATGLLSPANIAIPIRPLFRAHPHIRVLLDDAVGFDARAKLVQLRRCSLTYDTLIVASGSRHHYFGHPEWERFAPGLKTVEDAETIRSRIFSALEAAELATEPAAQQRYLTFVIAGGGPTSVELAGAVAEITRHAMRQEFRLIDPALARIVLIEAEIQVLGSFSSESSNEAARALQSLGVEVMLATRIVGVDAQGVTFANASGIGTVAAATVLWGAGVRASPLGAAVAEAVGQPLARGGRVSVSDCCTVPEHPEIFVLGDLAECTIAERTLPGVAQVAIQQGRYAARVILARAAGKRLPGPFRYQDRGSMATIGRRLAVADIGRWRLRGRVAWIAWLGLHLVKIMQWQNRLLVLVQWTWAYATWSRSARLITGVDAHGSPESGAANQTSAARADGTRGSGSGSPSRM